MVELGMYMTIEDESIPLKAEIKRPDIYIDGQRVEYVDAYYSRTFGEWTPTPAKLRIVLPNGQVLNISTMDERWTTCEDGRARIDFGIG